VGNFVFDSRGEKIERKREREREREKMKKKKREIGEKSIFLFLEGEAPSRIAKIFVEFGELLDPRMLRRSRLHLV